MCIRDSFYRGSDFLDSSASGGRKALDEAFHEEYCNTGRLTWQKSHNTALAARKNSAHIHEYSLLIFTLAALSYGYFSAITAKIRCV